MAKQKTKSYWMTTKPGIDQSRFLLSTISDIERNRYNVGKRPDPPVIAKMRKVVEAHDEVEESRRDDRRRRFEAACRKVRKAVHFSKTADEAKIAVEQLEAAVERGDWD